MPDRVKEKLVELLNEMQDSGIIEVPAGFGFTKQYIENERIADHLITNGVTVQECGHWVANKIFGGSTIFKCSECSREVEVTNDYFGKPSNHVAKYYPYCHCGAKMMPQPPKGE